jgi:hypothetical protein
MVKIAQFRTFNVVSRSRRTGRAHSSSFFRRIALTSTFLVGDGKQTARSNEDGGRSELMAMVWSYVHPSRRYIS